MIRRTQPRLGQTVRDDWCSCLPQRKATIFRTHEFELESYYTMLSVALNEALELHHCGRIAKSWQALVVAPALCERLASTILSALCGMDDHAKHYGTLPKAAPLNASNFRGSRGQRSAKLNGIINHVLLTHRSQFFYKLHALREMTQSLSQEFCEAASDLAGGSSKHPEVQWQTLDSAHFDLNTCLREAVVIFKSFLVVLPEEELAVFESSVRTLQRQSLRKSTSARKVPGWYHRRRAAQVAGR